MRSANETDVRQVLGNNQRRKQSSGNTGEQDVHSNKTQEEIKTK